MDVFLNDNCSIEIIVQFLKSKLCFPKIIRQSILLTNDNCQIQNGSAFTWLSQSRIKQAKTFHILVSCSILIVISEIKFRRKRNRKN